MNDNYDRYYSIICNQSRALVNPRMTNDPMRRRMIDRTHIHALLTIN